MRNRILTAAALTFAVALAGCDSFDPLDKFQDWDIMGSSKTPLRGERRPVFESGVPGVPQGVPPELVKGYQQPAEEPPPVVEAKPAKPAPKKTAAKPRRPPEPKAQPQQARQADGWPAPPQQQQQTAWPDPPQQMRQAPAARTTTQSAPNDAAAWPTMPGAQPTWPTNAQPAPQR
jgi:hypothetical protein